MTNSRRLSNYLSRNLVSSIALVGLLVAGVVSLFEVVNLAQSGSLFTSRILAILLDIGSRAIPLFQDLLPLIVLFAGLRVFIKLNASSEIIAIKAAGGSIWTIIRGPLALVFFIGVAVPFTLDPINALLLNIKENALSLSDRSTALSGQSQWFSQPGPKLGSNAGRTIIHAGATSADGRILGNVKVFGFDNLGKLQHQRHAQSAELKQVTATQNNWLLNDVKLYTSTDKAQQIQMDRLPTRMDATTVRTQFGDALSLPVWSLFSAIVQNSSSATVRPDVHMRFYSLIALPIFLVSTLMVAITFTIGYRRQGVSRISVLSSILVGFTIYVFVKVAQDSGDSGLIGAPVAAFGPALLILVVCTTVLLFLEDG